MYLTDNKINLCNNELQAYTRGLDKLGRWVIPKEIRDTLGFKDNQQLDIYLPGITSGVIQMAKYGCEWCDNTEDLIEVKGHSICRTCAGEVKEIA
jgi:transcriptional pleiotropic regulator of transition state genes